jgi:hypothetical protein
MGQSGQLVFEYFFYAASGVGVGLVLTVGGSFLIYKKIRGMKLWQSSGKKRQVSAR